MFRHLRPVALPSIVVCFTLRIETAVLTAGSLSSLGLGVQPQTPEWCDATGARLFLNVPPHMVIAPGTAITLAVLGFNLLGDGMRDALARGFGIEVVPRSLTAS